MLKFADALLLRIVFLGSLCVVSGLGANIDTVDPYPTREIEINPPEPPNGNEEPSISGEQAYT